MKSTAGLPKRMRLHRSGLALAGAQTTIEAWQRDEVPPVENDGILTAEDVSDSRFARNLVSDTFGV